MNQTMILYPAMAMLLLNLSVAVILLGRRIKAVQQGFNPAYFRFNRGVKMPGYLLTAEQHYQNIHEMPIVYFSLVVLIYLATKVNMLFLILAWCYVILRLIHTFIHMGHNNVLWRRNAFVASFVVLSLMWLGLLVEMLPVSQ